MAVREEIYHQGKVVSVGAETTLVRIISSAACASCHAAGLCGMTERQEKTVEVRSVPGLSEGQDVTLVLGASMGLKAVMLSYVAPLAVLLAVIIVMGALGVGELLSGLIGLAAVGLYYFLLWLFRKRIRREYVFTIKSTT